MKTCSKCGEEKPLSEYHKARTKDGFHSRCKACRKVESAEYYVANRDKRAAYGRARYEANREELKAQMLSYREANREKLAEGQRAYYAANREERLAYSREYGTKNRDKRKSDNRARYVADREERKAKARAYHAENRDEILVKMRTYQSKNREALTAQKRAYRATPEGRAAHDAIVHRRRARKRDAQCGCVTKASLRAVVEAYGISCVYCGSKYEDIDHVIPLAKGGMHCVGNLRPACGSCNSRKQALLLKTFLKRNPNLDGTLALAPALVACPNVLREAVLETQD